MKCEKKFQVDQHARTPSHMAKVQKMKSSGTQITLKMSVEKSVEKGGQAIFNDELCQALISANIPLKKLNNVQFKSFLQKYCNFNIPDESTIRKRGVVSVYNDVIHKIREEIAENYFYIIVDETTDSCGRYIAHMMIGTLQEDVSGRVHLIASKQLDKTNNLTVTRFIQDSLTKFFLPDVVPTEKLLIFLSDAAPYMLKVGLNLKIFYHNLIHVTCLAHGLNRVAEQIRNQYPLVNDLISNVKKIFLKAPIRIQLYKEKLPEVPLPPEPVVTRWGTWLNAAIFYAKHFTELKTLILQLVDTSQCVVKSQELLKNNVVAKQLLFIKSNYSFVPDSILALEKKSRPLVESIQVVEDFCKNCYSVQGETGKNVAGKLNDVIDKNLGYKYLKDISNFFLGRDVLDDLHLEYSLLPKLKFCPITSVDVERSFSLYKNVLTDRRQSFLSENLEMYLIVNTFYNNNV